MADTWYCIKCGRNHREGSTVAWQHARLRPDKRFDFEADAVAVGAAMADAASNSRSGNEARLEEIEASFEEMGLRRAFPDLDIRDKLFRLKDRHLIGRVRHSGHERFQFLANTGRAPGRVCSPKLFSQAMKSYAKDYKRSAIR